MNLPASKANLKSAPLSHHFQSSNLGIYFYQVLIGNYSPKRSKYSVYRNAINHYLSRFQQFIIRFIQEDCRQTGYFIIYWKRCENCIIFQYNKIRISGKSLYHIWIFFTFSGCESIKLCISDAFIQMLISYFFDILPELPAKLSQRASWQTGIQDLLFDFLRDFGCL